MSYYAKLGSSRADIAALLQPLPVLIIGADEPLSYAAGMLRPTTLEAGLSLGDRYCLALAQSEAATVLTAERRWRPLAEALGIEIELIR